MGPHCPSQVVAMMRSRQTLLLSLLCSVHVQPSCPARGNWGSLFLLKSWRNSGGGDNVSKGRKLKEEHFGIGLRNDCQSGLEGGASGGQAK